MYEADNDTWHQVLDKYAQEQDPQERVRQLRALASIQEPDLIKKYNKILHKWPS